MQQLYAEPYGEQETFTHNAILQPEDFYVASLSGLKSFPT